MINKPKLSRSWKKILFVCLISFLPGIYSCQNHQNELKVSGRVERDRVHIGSKLGGRVF